jgi:hypothetical protein
VLFQIHQAGDGKWKKEEALWHPYEADQQHWKRRVGLVDRIAGSSLMRMNMMYQLSRVGKQRRRSSD